MKILKIENGSGYFFVPEDTAWRPIDTIDKDGLMKLLNMFLEEAVEMDAVEADNLQNQAQLIIYKNIFDKLNSLKDNKSMFKDESERMYLDAIKKYSQ